MSQFGHDADNVDFNTLTSIENIYPDLTVNPTNSGMTEAELDGSSTRILYWYHPDYVGNVDLITDVNQEAHEFFLYNPWGESLYHWEAAPMQWSSPYRFNSKELDPETGMHYYGARYHNPKLSIWMSVDPLSKKYPSFSPYCYTGNNPIELFDPDGRWLPGVDENGNARYTAEKGDSYQSFKSQYNLSDEQASLMLDPNAEVVEGKTTVTGAQAERGIGSSVLRLDLNSDEATDQRKLDQFLFAVDHTKSNNQGGFYTTSYFGNATSTGSKFMRGIGNITVDGSTFQLAFEIPLFQVFGNISPTIYPYYLSNTTVTDNHSIGRFDNLFQDILLTYLPLYLPVGPKGDKLKRQRDYRLITKYEYLNLMRKRF